MYNATEDVKTALTFSVLRLRLVLSGSIIDEALYNLSYSAGCCGENIGIGTVSAASLSGSINGAVNILGVEFTAQVGVDVDGVTQWLNLGTFTVTECTLKDASTTFTAYDAAYSKLGQSYTPSEESGATARAVLEDVASQAGVEVEPSTLDLCTMTVTGDLTGHTCREMVGYIAALCGKNALITRDGLVRFVWFTESGETVTADDYYSGALGIEGEATLAGVRVTKKYTKTVTIGGVSAETDETDIYEAGTGSGTVIAVENPFATQEIVDAVWENIGGLGVYRWGNVECFGGLLTEPGDIVSVCDLSGAVSRVPVMRVELSLDGGCRGKISSWGKSQAEVAANVQGPMSQAMSRVEADLARFKELEADNARIQQATIDRLITTEIKSTNYKEIAVPLVYPESGLYPSDVTFASDGRTIYKGYRIDLSTGTMYGNWSLPQEIWDRLDMLENGPLYPRAELYPA